MLFSKTHQSFLNLKSFLKSTRPSLPLKKGLSKTHQSSLTLKGGSTAFPKPLSPQGTGDVPTALLGAQTATLYGWRTIRGLRQQRSCSFLCGDEPAFTQGFAKGLLARCFFRKPTRPSLPLRKAPHLSPSLSLLRRERMCQPPFQ